MAHVVVELLEVLVARLATHEAGDVSFAFEGLGDGDFARFEAFLHEEVVGGGDVVVFVGFDAFAGVVFAEVRAFGFEGVGELFEDAFVEGDLVLADDYAFVLGFVALFVPRMISNFLYRVSFISISIQNILQQVRRLFRHKLRYLIICTQNLLIQSTGIWILKGQKPTNHCEQNNPC